MQGRLMKLELMLLFAGVWAPASGRAELVTVATAAIVKIAEDPTIIGRTVDRVPFPLPNVVTKTLGGKFWWKVVMEAHGWKLQCHKSAGNCRILDPDDYRYAWGGRQAMTEAFEHLKSNGMVFYSARGLPEVTTRTMGGKVLWDELATQQGWRVQRNKVSAHCRLLDPKDNRLLWGRCVDVERLLEKLVHASP